MSFQASVSKLSGPVKALVTTTADGDSTFLGKTDADQSEVNGWLEKVGQGEIVKQDNLAALDTQLIPKTYVVGNYLTAATFAKFQPTQYFSHPALTRYFDHIQSCPPVRKSAEKLSSFPLVSFDLLRAPKLERTAEPPKKKKEKTPAATPPAEATASTPPTEAAATTSEPKTQKKEKKDKKKDAATAPAQDAGKKKGGKAASPAADEGEPVPSMIDLRVGHIIDVKKHPDADGLYIEQIDIGEETGPRTVVSGLVHYIPIEQMQGKYLVAVCNLKPANMRGVKSFAMVLAATHKDGKDRGIELIQPPPGSKPGDRVYFEGEEFEDATPLSQLNPKKKIFETVTTREAAWVNPVTKKVHKIRTKEGVCLAPTFVGASLS
ncbi:nucleic acid-binding protein [Hymenopellis radicata]|nr:nucleic acid-binding protein [Hymenopellis radicata]